MEWIDNYLRSILWDASTYVGPEFKGSLAKPPLTLGHEILHCERNCSYMTGLE